MISKKIIFSFIISSFCLPVLCFASSVENKNLPSNLTIINNSDYRIMVMPHLMTNAYHYVDPKEQLPLLLTQEEKRFVAICWGANPTSRGCIMDFNDPTKVCYLPIKIIVTGNLAQRNLKVECFDRA